MPDLLVTPRDRFKCFMRGHDVEGWGTISGHCKRCHHAVWTHEPRSVMLYGRTYRYPPAHTPASEKSLRRLGYTRGGVPEPRDSSLPSFSRKQALSLYGHEDDYLRERGLLDA